MDFRNKYLKYKPEITFDIFQEVWDRLISFGYRPFNDSTSIKRYNEFKSFYCFLKTTKDHPMEFSCYSSVADSYSETTVQEILGYDPFVKDDDFVLPEKWYVEVTTENKSTLNDWKVKQEYSISLYCSDYKFISENGGGYHREDSIKDAVKITFDQFKKYVLKQNIDVEIEQDDICKYCETNIIGGSGNTQHFQCEGRYCQRAKEELIETIDNSKAQTKQAVHCETQEQWDFVTEKLGYEWNTAAWTDYGNNTCVNLEYKGAGTADVAYIGYQILSFSDWRTQSNYEFQPKATSSNPMFDFNVSEQTANNISETIDIAIQTAKVGMLKDALKSFTCDIQHYDHEFLAQMLGGKVSKVNKVQISTDNEIKINIIQKQSIKI